MPSILSRRRLGLLGLATLALAGCEGQSYPYQPPPPQAAATAPQRVELGADVLFAFNSATLRPEASAALTAALSSIRQTIPYPAIRVEGHTDGIGSDAFNDDLSLRRANAVRDWLAANGIPPQAITTAGFGKRNPVAPNTLPNGADNPEGRARNRRVVLIATPA